MSSEEKKRKPKRKAASATGERKKKSTKPPRPDRRKSTGKKRGKKSAGSSATSGTAEGMDAGQLTALLMTHYGFPVATQTEVTVQPLVVKRGRDIATDEKEEEKKDSKQTTQTTRRKKTTKSHGPPDPIARVFEGKGSSVASSKDAPAAALYTLDGPLTWTAETFAATAAALAATGKYAMWVILCTRVTKRLAMELRQSLSHCPVHMQVQLLAFSEIADYVANASMRKHNLLRLLRPLWSVRRTMLASVGRLGFALSIDDAKRATALSFAQFYRSAADNSNRHIHCHMHFTATNDDSKQGLLIVYRNDETAAETLNFLRPHLTDQLAVTILVTTPKQARSVSLLMAKEPRMSKRFAVWSAPRGELFRDICAHKWNVKSNIRIVEEKEAGEICAHFHVQESSQLFAILDNDPLLARLGQPVMIHSKVPDDVYRHVQPSHQVTTGQTRLRAPKTSTMEDTGYLV